MPKPLADQFADFATTLKFEDLPKDVVHEVKRRVLGENVEIRITATDETNTRIKPRKIISGSAFRTSGFGPPGSVRAGPRGAL